MIWDIKDIHKEIHNALMSRKRVDVLWGSSLDNALIGLILYEHRHRNDILIGQIKKHLRQALDKIPVEDHRSGSLLGLCVAFFHQVGDNHYFQRALRKLNHCLDTLMQKELDSKFSLLNSPELVYFVARGLAAARENIPSHVLDRFIGVIKTESHQRWRDKPFRFAFYTAAGIELNVNEIIGAAKRFLGSLDISTILPNEIIPLIWLLARYEDHLAPENGLLDTIIQQFKSQEGAFVLSDQEAEVNGRHYLSTFELALLDEAFAILEAGFVVPPNDIFDLLELHPRIKKASERLFKDGHYHNAVREAYITLEALVKEKSGISDLSGTKLMTEVFSFEYDKKDKKIKKKPILMLNTLKTLTERDEQQGFMYLFMGASLAIRNPSVHESFIRDDPFAALKLLAFASMLAKRLDEAKKTEGPKS